MALFISRRGPIRGMPRFRERAIAPPYEQPGPARRDSSLIFRPVQFAKLHLNRQTVPVYSSAVELDPEAGQSLYLQLADALAGQIEAGTYRAGDRIPSVRKLREQFGVSLSTVLEACRVLEDRGLVQARAQSGHYVRAPRPRPRSEPEESAASSEAKHVDASLALRLNLGIGNPQEPTLGAAVQGPELMAVTALNRLMSHVLRLQPAACHSYDAPPGSAVLRRSIAQ